jgi:SAM-dependent methyltransferase
MMTTARRADRPYPAHSARVSAALPLPPLELRELVGQTDPAWYDLPEGGSAFGTLPQAAYESVLDFGCGCGRVARQLLQQDPRPGRYVGIDLHRGMIEWCRRNLAPVDPAFRFEHHDVFSAGLNPVPGAPRVLRLPAEDASCTLVVASSVFTHLTESQAVHYLAEAARVLRGGGLVVSTWFLFEKRAFPMMQAFQNALYINETDLTNAVIYDREWLATATRQAGLRIIEAHPPNIRGFHWDIVLARDESGPSIEIPEDTAPFGSNPPPAMPPQAERLGLDEEPGR